MEPIISFHDEYSLSYSLQGYDQSNIINQYELEQIIGEGTFGNIFMGTNIKTKEKVAIKAFDYTLANNDAIDSMRNEIELLKSLNHKNIVKLIEVIEKEHVTYLVLEFVQGGDLLQLVEKKGKLKEAQSVRILKQLVEALEYCHNKSISHRDLKLENILIDALGDVKLSDFRLAIKTPGVIDSFVGSVLYSAPEVIFEIPFHGELSDVWSLGVCFYGMLTGSVPWEGVSLREQVRNLAVAKYVKPEFISSHSLKLLECMLQPTPKKRSTLSQLHKMINECLVKLDGFTSYESNKSKSSSCYLKPTLRSHSSTNSIQLSPRSMEANASKAKHSSTPTTPIPATKKKSIWKLFKKQKETVDDIRTSKAKFTPDRLTTLPVDQIKSKIEAILTDLNLNFVSQKSMYLVKSSSVGLCIEICNIHNLEGFKGIKIKSICGNSNSQSNQNYQTIQNNIIESFKTSQLNKAVC